MVDWKYVQKNVRKFFHNYVSIESIGLIFVIILCIYVFIKYDKGGTKLHKSTGLFFTPKKFHNAVTDEFYKNMMKPPKKKREYGKSENTCRKIFEAIFDKEFPSIRPDFLKNPVSGQNLELDGYCEELKLAFEYDGAQHNKYTPHFHKDRHDFDYQVSKDKYKSQKCKEFGIDLIRIPHYIPPHHFEDYIRSELKKINRLPPI